jgi:hypothetical protein
MWQALRWLQTGTTRWLSPEFKFLARAAIGREAINIRQFWSKVDSSLHSPKLD